MNRRTFGSYLLGLLQLPPAVQATRVALPINAKEENLVVMPLLGTREVFVVPPARPHCFVRHLSLEGFGCRNWQVVPNAVEGVWATNHTWEWRDDGTFGCIGRVTEGVRYTLEIRPGTDLLDLRVTVQNFGKQTLKGLYAAMCVDIRRNVVMYDPTLERSYVSVSGRPVPMSQTDVAGSHGGVMPVYFLNETAPGDRWIPDASAAYGWRISATDLDSPLTAVASRDLHWFVGTWFWPCHSVTGNAKIPDHGCIHSNPAFGTLRPGKSATAVGRIYIVSGSLEKVWERMATDWRRARMGKLSAST